MRYEIVRMDGLYCVFNEERIIAAFETLKEAKEAVRRYKKERRK